MSFLAVGMFIGHLEKKTILKSKNIRKKFNFQNSIITASLKFKGEYGDTTFTLVEIVRNTVVSDFYWN